MRVLSRIATGIVLLIPMSVYAQNASWSGKYQGTAKDGNSDVQMSLDLTDDGGKFAGTVVTPRGTFTIGKGQIAQNVFTADLTGTTSADGATGKLTLRQKDEKLVGDVSIAGKSMPVEFKKATTIDELSGEWDAVADAQGQPFPFTLSLKLEGENVTGSSDSQLGHANISKGAWKDGKLAIALEGNITLVATMSEGKLSGEYDFQGQSSGKWVAVKKK